MSVRLLAFLGLGLLAIAAGVLLWLQMNNPNSQQSEAISFPTYDTPADLSEAFIGPRNQDEDRLLSLITGYEGAAEQLRDAALTYQFPRAVRPNRPAETPILALRDRFPPAIFSPCPRKTSSKFTQTIPVDPGLPAGAKALSMV